MSLHLSVCGEIGLQRERVNISVSQENSVIPLRIPDIYKDTGDRQHSRNLNAFKKRDKRRKVGERWILNRYLFQK
jgi:hypothetical protein